MSLFSVDTSAFSVVPMSAQADRSNLKYWLSKTPDERFAAIEQLRQVAYGYTEASAGLQRVLEVIERPVC